MAAEVLLSRLVLLRLVAFERSGHVSALQRRVRQVLLALLKRHVVPTLTDAVRFEQRRFSLLRVGVGEALGVVCVNDWAQDAREVVALGAPSVCLLSYIAALVFVGELRVRSPHFGVCLRIFARRRVALGCHR